MNKAVKKKKKNPPHKTLTKPGPKEIQFSQDDLDKIKRLAGVFMSVTEIAAIMGVSKDTMYRRMKTDHRIREAIEKAPQETKAAIVSTMARKAIKGDQRAAEFLLERKGGFIKQEEVQQNQNVRFVVEMTDDGKFKNQRPRQIEDGSTIDVEFEDADD